MNLNSRNLKKIGEIGVDSGQVMVLDPCYCKHFINNEYEGNDSSPPTEKFSYDAACRKTVEPPFYGELENGSAVVSSTAYGDGTYSVYAVIRKNGEIRGLFVDFDNIIEADEERTDISAGNDFGIG